MAPLSGSLHPKPGSGRRLFATAVVVAVADQVVKKMITAAIGLGRSVDLLGPFVRLTHTSNTGAAFGILRGRGPWFVVIAAAAALAIVAFRREIASMRAWEQVSFGLILGGAVGNLIDRLRLGAVVDFIDIGVGDLRWPAFNVADSAITIGVVVLAINLLFRSRPSPRSASEAGTP